MAACYKGDAGGWQVRQCSAGALVRTYIRPHPATRAHDTVAAPPPPHLQHGRTHWVLVRADPPSIVQRGARVL
ncbi:hypothetical protein EON67_02320 [archaeon]|nr:MAG: hypothetical protein EON67_02320 [archaeon]